MKKIIIRLLIVVFALVGVALVVVFLMLGSIVKKGVETVGPEVTKVDVKLDAAEVSPFSGAGRLIKFSLGNPEGFKSPTSFQVGEIKLGVKPGSVMSDVVVIEGISIVDPQVTLGGTLTANNLSKILDNIKGTGQVSPSAKPAETTTGQKPEKKFIVKDFLLKGAKMNIDLNIPIVGQVNKTLTLGDIHLQDIGVKENGITSAQLAQVLFGELEKQALAAAQDLLKTLANGQGLGDAEDKAKKGAQSLMDMIKK